MMVPFLCLLLVTVQSLGSTVPEWPATYQMNLSTIVMTCNYSGYMSAEANTKLARFGVVDIDWSNAKMYVTFKRSFPSTHIY